MITVIKVILKYYRDKLSMIFRDARIEIANWGRFWSDFISYRGMVSKQANIRYSFFPCLTDYTSTTPIGPIYFYQNAWAFNHIVKQDPVRHIDVGSHHEFVALLSKVVPVTMVDIRPLELPMESIDFQKGTILDLPFMDGSIPSVSSICVVEHIGLGRYGDPLDPDGTEKAIAELKRIVMPGGDLFISLPLDDRNTVYFNAHRAFTEAYLIDLFFPFELVDAKYICGTKFSDFRQPGFGVGCYYLKKPVR